MIRFIERALWNSRLMVLSGVFTSLALALGMFIMAVVDTVSLGGMLGSYPLTNPSARTDLRLDLVAQAVGIVDSLLIAAVMLILGMGLYDLFVRKIEIANERDVARRILVVDSLDDLKEKVGRMILLVLVVKFFQVAVGLKYVTSVDLLILAVGTTLVSGALFLAYGKLSH